MSCSSWNLSLDQLSQTPAKEEEEKELDTEDTTTTNSAIRTTVPTTTNAKVKTNNPTFTPNRTEKKERIDPRSLLNFHTKTPSDLPSSSSSFLSSNACHILSKGAAPYPKRSQQKPKDSNEKYKNKYKYKYAAQERDTRQKLHSSFFLHASPLHAFVLSPPTFTSSSSPSSSPKWSRSTAQKPNTASSPYSYSGPDQLISWEAIRLVKCFVQPPPSSLPSFCTNESLISVQTNQLFPTTACPICLEDTCIAPRITKCGHFFCLPCLLRHFFSSQTDAKNTPSDHDLSYHSRSSDLWSKCPCCLQSIPLSELKPVQFITVQTPMIGTKMQFQKLYRCKHLPIPFVMPYPTKMTSLDFYPTTLPTMMDSNAAYCRLNYMDRTTFLQLLDMDRRAIQLELDEWFPQEPPLPLSSSLSSLSLSQQQEQQQQQDTLPSLSFAKNLNLSSLSMTSSNHSTQMIYFLTMALQYIQVEERDILLAFESNLEPSLPTDTELHFPSSSSRTTVHSTTTKNGENNNRSSSSKSLENQDHLTYFYQAMDGQLCFLSGFNLHCLSMDYSEYSSSIGSSFSSCPTSLDQHPSIHEDNNKIHENDMKPPFPDILQGQVVDMERIHITPEIRKRMTCLAHLPLYTDVTIVELDLNPILSVKAKEECKSDIARRKKKRQERKNIEKEENRKAIAREEKRVQDRKKQQRSPSLPHSMDDFFPILPMMEPPNIMDETFGPQLSTVPSLESSSLSMSMSVSVSVSDSPSPKVKKESQVQNVTPCSPFSFRSVCLSGNVDHPQKKIHRPSSMNSNKVSMNNPAEVFESSFPSLSLSMSPKTNHDHGTSNKDHKSHDHNDKEKMNPKKQNESVVETDTVSTYPFTILKPKGKKSKDKISLFSNGLQYGHI